MGVSLDDELKNHVRVRIKEVPEESVNMESDHHSFPLSEGSRSTTKECRINLRLSATRLRDIARRAELEGLPTATYVRGLIQRDISRDLDAVIRRLARIMVYSSVALYQLFFLIGLRGKSARLNAKLYGY